MTYPTLAAVFLAIAVVGGVVVPLLVRSRPGAARSHPWPRFGAVVVTIVALVILTAVFDSIMIAAELFHYDPATLAGPHIGLAPIEDFAYPLATAILLPAVWETLRRRRRAVEQRDAVEGPTEGRPGARKDEAR